MASHRARLATRRRLAIVAASATAAALSVAFPASGGRLPQVDASIAPTATACTFHVTYSWNGVSGPTNAYLRVVYQIPGQQFGTAAATANVAVTGRSGSVSVDLAVTGQGFQSFYGRGSLQNRKNQEISGTQATSTTSVAASC